MGYLNAQSLKILHDTANNGIEYSGTFYPCDICSVEKSTRRDHPKKADHGCEAPFAKIFTDMIDHISPPSSLPHIQPRDEKVAESRSVTFIEILPSSRFHRTTLRTWWMTYLQDVYH